MDEQNEQRQAAKALAMVHEHQERTRRAARIPPWVYAAMFVLSAGATAANDFVDVSGAKLIAALVLVMFVVALAMTFAGRSAPLSRVRGVQRRQSFAPPVFGVILVLAAVGSWLISRYGADLADDIANATGTHDYPNTVLGVLYGAAFTALFALGQLLTTEYQRRTDR